MKEQLFIEQFLPNPLSKEEFNNYFTKYKNGDKESYDIILKHNIRLVLFVVNRFLYKYEFEDESNSLNLQCEKEDLVSVGIIGLMKSISSFDINKGYEFSSFAYICIQNEILLYLRRERKHKSYISLDDLIKVDKTGNEVLLDNILSDGKFDDVSFYDDYITNLDVRRLVERLSSRERTVIGLYFGFGDDVLHTQKEIAAKLKLSRNTIQKTLSKAMKKLKYQMDEYS